ncbi:hypothetical protein BGZ57DRAFT_944011 [Hyaloscypha finlandica]|nr:hypothetical protein BGZ57DRAFT_944011 [Hyaloscypha finlandica]
MKLFSRLAVAGLSGLTTAQNSTTFNPTLNIEEFYYYYDQWPIDLAVSKQGRVFACYARERYAYSQGEIVKQAGELPYPPLELDTPPGGLSMSQTASTLYITPDDSLWILDTEQPTTNQPLAPTSGGGIAYIVDWSNEGRTGFVMIGLGTGESWRQLSQHPSTLRTYTGVPSYSGILFYLRQKGNPLDFQEEGLDGAEPSLYCNILYCSPLTSNYRFSTETQYFRANPFCDTLSAKRAFDIVKNLGLGNVYIWMMLSQNAIYTYNATTVQAQPYVYDPRTIWCDSANLPYQPDWNAGVDRR